MTIILAEVAGVVAVEAVEEAVVHFKTDFPDRARSQLDLIIIEIVFVLLRTHKNSRICMCVLSLSVFFVDLMTERVHFLLC